MGHFRSPCCGLGSLKDTIAIMGYMVNTTILVPARTKLVIPVACVEQGRWGRSLGAMAPAEALYPAARRAKAEAVTRSVRLAGTYDADQTAILDAYRQHDADLDAYARGPSAGSTPARPILRARRVGHGERGSGCGGRAALHGGRRPRDDNRPPR